MSDRMGVAAEADPFGETGLGVRDTGLNVAATLRFALAILIAAALLGVMAGEAQAHHGGRGDYDASRPLYLEGTVEDASYSYPHALIDLEVPEGTRAPEAPPAAAEGLRGYEHWERLSPVEAGSHELLLPPDLTGEMGRAANRPEVGDRVSAIAYPECETGELRVQLIRFADETLTYGGAITHIVDGCPGSSGSGAAAADEDGGSAESEAQAGTESDVDPQASSANDGGSSGPERGRLSVPVVGLAATVLVGGAAAYVVLHGGRRPAAEGSRRRRRTDDPDSTRR